MTEAVVPAKATKRRVFWVVLAGLLLVGGGALGASAHALWQRLTQRDLDVRTIRSSADVVVAVRDLARLEGADYQIERVISLTEEQSRLYGLVKAKDAILLVASGTVTAGVDLSALREGDVVVDFERKAARFTLPTSTVLRAALDADRTYVFQRETDLLATRKESLEADARKEAESTLRGAAEKSGIVERSNKSVKKTVESLARSLGFVDVIVEFRPEPLLGEKH
jgi:hypothetical protein